MYDYGSSFNNVSQVFEFDASATADERAHCKVNPWTTDLGRAAHELGHGCTVEDVRALIRQGEIGDHGTRDRPMVNLWEVADHRAKLDARIGKQAQVNERRALESKVRAQELEIERLKRMLTSSKAPVPGATD